MSAFPRATEREPGLNSAAVLCCGALAVLCLSLPYLQGTHSVTARPKAAGIVCGQSLLLQSLARIRADREPPGDEDKSRVNTRESIEIS